MLHPVADGFIRVVEVVPNTFGVLILGRLLTYVFFFLLFSDMHQL